MRKVLLSLSLVLATLISPVSAMAATLSVSPTTGSFNKGCSFAVKVNLDTKGVETDGSDVILTYDPAQLSALSVVNGTLFADYPGNNIDPKTGKISIYGLAAVDKGITTSGTVATVNFQVLSGATASSTPVKFDFDPKAPTKTTDSNVIRKSDLTDILTSVTNGTYTVGSGSTCGTVTPTPVASDSAEVLPDSGLTMPTQLVFVSSLLLVGLGLLGAAKFRN